MTPTAPSSRTRTPLLLALAFILIAALVFLANSLHSPQRDAIADRTRQNLAAAQALPASTSSHPASIPATTP